MATGQEMDILSTDGLFAGNHQAVNEWASEGRTLAPWLQMPMESQAKGDSRHQTDNLPSQMWDAQVIVNTPITGGGGATMQKPLSGNM